MTCEERNPQSARLSFCASSRVGLVLGLGTPLFLWLVGDHTSLVVHIAILGEETRLVELDGFMAMISLTTYRPE